MRAHPTALACKGSMRRCSAMRRPTCFGLGCTCRLHECGGIGQCVLLHSVCTSLVRSKVESLRALHQCTNVQRRVALHAAPATRVARPAPGGGTTTFRGVTADASWCTSGGICVRLRCAAFATRRATVESLRRLTCRCNGTRAETIAASRPAVVRCAATVEAQVRGPPVPWSDRFVQSTQIAARPLPT